MFCSGRLLTGPNASVNPRLWICWSLTCKRCVSLHLEDVSELLRRVSGCYSVCLYRWCVEAGQLDESSLVQTASSELSSEDQELLKAYHHSFDDEKVDLDLILHLLFNICQSSDEGETVNSMKHSFCRRLNRLFFILRRGVDIPARLRWDRVSEGSHRLWW